MARSALADKTVKCLGCGVRFSPVDRRRKYHSLACANSTRKPVVDTSRGIFSSASLAKELGINRMQAARRIREFLSSGDEYALFRDRYSRAGNHSLFGISVSISDLSILSGISKIAMYERAKKHCADDPSSLIFLAGTRSERACRGHKKWIQAPDRKDK